MATVAQETAPKQAPASKKAKGGASPAKKKSQPGRYSQLVIDTVRRLGERNGSSLARVFNEAKKVPWFDQQNGRTYLRYSIKALLQNDTLLQVKGTGANGSFKLNRGKLEGKKKGATKAASPSAPKKAKPSSPEKSPKKAKPPTLQKSPKKAKPPTLQKSPKKAKPAGITPKKSHKKGASLAAKKVKRAAKPRVGKA
ncbi:hypothetical protein NDU88_008270 [Pleurodeles waltl]|uniref:H15 domain-containing protein n=1 Tax=Pleurodeles waltl TaxID=8319 RepID=A0AAV7N637_PLEWA|nr:hypothetical protein NDU88_008270 [Pleurodeles waltl]